MRQLKNTKIGIINRLLSEFVEIAHAEHDRQLQSLILLIVCI